MGSLLSRFFADRRGATSIEYAIIAGGICLVIVSVVNGLGVKTGAMYTNVANSLQ